jgi:hypothetical protein
VICIKPNFESGRTVDLALSSIISSFITL